MSEERAILPVPESEQRVLDNLLKDLNETYPDKVIKGLEKNHKTWSEKVTRLYKNIGYKSRDEFLAAYGFTVERVKGGGRPAEDLNAIAEEILRRYEGDISVTSVQQLKEENPDLAPKFKSLQNKAKELFGMTFVVYLKKNGVIKRNASRAEKRIGDNMEILIESGEVAKSEEVVKKLNENNKRERNTVGDDLSLSPIEEKIEYLKQKYVVDSNNSDDVDKGKEKAANKNDAKKVFKIYENIDRIDPAELKRAAGLKDPEKITWPKGKKYTVQLEGTECSVTTYFSRAKESLYGHYDAYNALSTMMTRDEVVERIRKADPDGGSDAAYYAAAEFLPGLEDLTSDEKEHRKAFTAAILTLLSDQSTMQVIAECAPRKKNGLFHKGKVFKIGLTGLADKYSNELIEIVGKSKEETKLSVSVTKRRTSPEELEQWENDFISTYHEGLLISEALKTVFENIKNIQDSSASKVIKKGKIVPDIFKGMGDGTQELDVSGLEETIDNTKGLCAINKEKAQSMLDKISKHLVDPNTIDWNGKGVYIDRDVNNVFKNKIREMGAVPLRSPLKSMNYRIANLDFDTYGKRGKSEEAYLINLQSTLNFTDHAGIIDEREFLKWCATDHEIKYDLNKDEHLKEFEDNKISYKKIDARKFIRRAIEKINPGNYDENSAGDNYYILYCVVGSGDKAKIIRSFLRKIGKVVMDKYTEGARWPYLILDDPDGAEERRAYKVALYNRKCEEKVQVWNADDVIDLIYLYGERIENQVKKVYDNHNLKPYVEWIIGSAAK